VLWLPVQQVKVATLVHQAMSGHAPSYLADDCCLITDAHPYYYYYYYLQYCYCIGNEFFVGQKPF